MKITDAQIAELQRLEQDATPGPWEARSLDSPCVIHVSQDEFNRRVTAFVAACSSSTLENSDNAVLIAALRNAAPALLDEIVRLWKIEAAARRWGTAIDDPEISYDAEGVFEFEFWDTLEER